jgi:hypothetical protein
MNFTLAMSTQVTASCVSTRTATGESKQYMNARDNCYEPDDEELAYELYKERVFEDMRIEYADFDRELRDYHKHTDRQLRDLNKEKKSLRRELWREYCYDVTDNTYEVHLDSETSITMPREGLRRDEASRPLTRKDKTKQKKEHRKRQRFLENLMRARGRNPAQSSVVRKTGALLPVVAAM